MEDLSKYNPEGSELRVIQLRMLDILLKIDAFCKQYGINYWLEGGTMLGAVRHGGFLRRERPSRIVAMSFCEPRS